VWPIRYDVAALVGAWCASETTSTPSRVNPKPNGLSQNPDEMPQPMNGVLFWAKKSLAPRNGVITGTAAKIWSSWTSFRPSSRSLF